MSLYSYLSRRAQISVVCIVPILLYAQTLGYDYVLDDGELVVRQPSVNKGVKGIWELLTTATTFTGTFSAIPNESDNNTLLVQRQAQQRRSSYRPLSFITFAVEYEFAGHSALVRHAVNILLYVGVVVLVFYAAEEIAAIVHPLVPFCVALMFAVHPLHVEVVCNIKSRDELLVALCSIAALVLALRYATTGKVSTLIAAGVVFFLALLSKENAITMVPIFPLVVWIVHRRVPMHRCVWVAAVMVLAACLWLGISVVRASWWIEDANFRSLLNNPYARALPEQVFPTKIAVVGEYVGKLLYPLVLSYDYGYRVIEPIHWGWKPIGALLVLIALAAHALWYIRSVNAVDNRPALGLLWMLVAMSIVSNLVVYAGAAMADRFMFLPSVGWVVALSTGILWAGGRLRIQGWEGFAFVLWGCIVIAYAVRSLLYIPAWQNSYQLARAAVQSTPQSVKAHAGLVVEASLKAKDTRDSLERAIYIQEVYRSAHALIELAPAYSRGYYTLALYFERYAPYEDTPNRDSARFYYCEALEREPENREYRYDWAMFRGHAISAHLPNLPDSVLDSALACYREALQYNITPHLPLANIGSLYARQQRYAEALPYLQKAVALYPYDAEINRRLALCSAQEALERGNAALRARLLDSALAAYYEATRFGVAADAAWLNIAVVQSQRGKYGEAKQAIQEALRINPANMLAQRMAEQLERYLSVQPR
ncbi:MAG: tetratricopeptide repeat protein [Bacteroidota bacterium]|nr:tetratricopeptide repeat protein [Candidatus Kapabacteria bacterium]MDW8219188.1 tetratricopeptide repeat protein [Bacteroidota bacterium]